MIMKKKAYLNPALVIMIVNECLPIAVSNPGEDGVGINKDAAGVTPDAFGTKEFDDWNIWDN